MTLYYSACIILSDILLSVRLKDDYVCMSVWILILYVVWILILLVCPYYDSVCLSEP